MSKPIHTKPIQTTVRMSDSSERVIREVMAETGASRSLVLRAMLATAGEHRNDVIDKLRAQL